MILKTKNIFLFLWMFGLKVKASSELSLPYQQLTRSEFPKARLILKKFQKAKKSDQVNFEFQTAVSNRVFQEKKTCCIRGGKCPALQLSTTLHKNRTVKWLAPTLGWGCIILYHFIAQKLSNWKVSWRIRSARARALWAVQICESGDATLGVQTIRNALTASCFLASTATAILSLIVTLAYQHTVWTTLRVIKYASAIMLLTASGFCFLQTARYLSHVGFLFSVAIDSRDPSVNIQTVALMMMIQYKFWWLGLRFLYLSFPAIIWIVAGPIAMLLTSVLVLFVLNYFDSTLPSESTLFSETGLSTDIFVPSQKDMAQ